MYEIQYVLIDISLSFHFQDLCVGTKNLTDDIIPCTWVGYNISGSAEIKNGALWVNGMEIRKLSELRPQQDYSNGTNSSSSQNTFRMPIGQQMFITMRLCNKAMLCTNRSLAVVLIKNSASLVGVSDNGTAIEEKLTMTSRKRAARELDIKTPSGEKRRNIIFMRHTILEVHYFLTKVYLNMSQMISFLFAFATRPGCWTVYNCDSSEA